MQYKVVMTDLDGTLLNDKHEISIENQNALKAIESQGVPVVYASGRMYNAVKKITKGYDAGGIIAACNGGYIFDVSKKHIISETHFTFEASLAIIEVLERLNLSHHFYTGDAVYAQHNENSKQYRSWQGFLDEIKIRFIAHSPLGKFIHEGAKPHKFGVFLDPSTNVEALKNELYLIPGVDCFKSAERLLDIMPEGINKGFALRKITEYLNINQDAVIACGDHENDIEMLKAAGVAIAPYGSVAGVIEQSDFQLGSEEPHVIAYIYQNFF